MAATPKTIPDTRPDRDIYLYGHFLHTLFFFLPTISLVVISLLLLLETGCVKAECYMGVSKICNAPPPQMHLPDEGESL